MNAAGIASANLIKATQAFTNDKHVGLSTPEEVALATSRALSWYGTDNNPNYASIGQSIYALLKHALDASSGKMDTEKFKKVVADLKYITL